MNRYYLTAEQTGQRDVQPRPFFVEDQADDRSWLDHERLAWEHEDDPYLPYRPLRRRHSLPDDFPAADLPDIHPAGRRADDRQPRRRELPPGVYQRGDWPGQALSEFFGGYALSYGRRRRFPDAERSMWSQPDHRGRGPKGYRRSDERILEEICERLSDDPLIDASDIAVRCEAGRVVLEGAVDDRAIKYRIEDLVDDCAGVDAIENRLTVNRTRDRANIGRARDEPSPLDTTRW